MTQEILIATRNPHKIREILALLCDLEIKVRSLNDFPEIPDIEETGSTFSENALLKARTGYHYRKLWTLGEDSGLEVDYLNGAPGIYSSRYAGHPSSAGRDAANNQKLLQALKGVPPEKRGAQFRCVIAIAGPHNTEKVVEGIVRGSIIESLRGKEGFGYDPLFVPEDDQYTFAELGERIKNQISHRSIALQKALTFLTAQLI